MPNTATQTQQVKLRKKGSTVRAFQLAFLIFIVAAVALGLWGVVQQRPQSGVLKEVAGYKLLRSVEGPQALQMISGLHQGTLQISSAWIAYYEGEATVWVGNAATPYDAQQQLQAMLEAISRGNTPFAMPQQTQMAGRLVFATTDRQSNHYFFQSGTRVVWVAAPAGGEARFVEAVLRKL